MTTIIADLETDGFLDVVSVIWCIGTFNETTKKYEEFNDQGNGCRSIKEGLAYLNSADTVVFHNGYNYDLPVIEKLHPEFRLDPRKVEDTMVLSRLYNPQRRFHTLDALGTDLFKQPKSQSPDYSRYSDEMSTYLRQDIRIGVMLHRYLKERLAGWGRSVEIEHGFAWIIGLQMRNGFCLDVPAAYSLNADLSDQQQKLVDQLVAVFPPVYVSAGEFTPKKDAKNGYVAGAPFTRVKIEDFNPGSRQQIAQRLIRKYGWKPTAYTAGGSPEISEETIARLSYPEAKLLGEYLRLDKMIGMLSSEIKANGSGGGWLKHEKNGRVHGYVNSNGAVTGRCTHSKPNVAQADKDKRMRSLWIPRVGWKLVGCDAEGIELRMLGHYLAKWDGGAFIKSVTQGSSSDGTDPHTINQRIVGLYLRNSAKTFIYAMIYGAGDAKLGTIILEDAVAAGKLTPEDSPHLYEVKSKANGKKGLRSKSQLGKDARAKIETGIKGLGELVKAVKARAKTKGYLVGLDGRRLYVRKEHAALNTLLQAAGAVCMKQAAIHFLDTVEDIGFPHGSHWAFCANVHDEVQIEADPQLAENLGKAFAMSITKAGAALGVRCPMAGKYDIGINWSETH